MQVRLTAADSCDFLWLLLDYILVDFYDIHGGYWRCFTVYITALQIVRHHCCCVIFSFLRQVFVIKTWTPICHWIFTGFLRRMSCITVGELWLDVFPTLDCLFHHVSLSPSSTVVFLEIVMVEISGEVSSSNRSEIGSLSTPTRMATPLILRPFQTHSFVDCFIVRIVYFWTPYIGDYWRYFHMSLLDSLTCFCSLITLTVSVLSYSLLL